MQTVSPLSDRAAGVLLHVTSLPSVWGVGDIGPTARDFAHRLGEAGLRYWQVLPLNPTTGGAGDSPYFSDSALAGNPLLLSIDDLVADGLLNECEVNVPGLTGPMADFEQARTCKLPLLRLAAQRVVAAAPTDYVDFSRTHAHWLEDHALFTALSGQHGARWRDWPEPLKYRDGEALAAAAAEHALGVDIEKGLQYLFYRQWRALHAHCTAAGVALFGDMPIYVNTDSTDVWAAPGGFQLDAGLNPVLESGVPPDYFSATGQLWRNPVYDWDFHQSDCFRWWSARLRTQLERLDLLRIDHFRGLSQYWAVPAGSATAEHGRWLDVPAYALLDTLFSAIDPLPLVAEDLGTITPDVIALRDHYQLPGMIVLQFAFGDDHADNPFKPHNHRENAVAYLGTHDNNTTRGWLETELDDTARARLGGHVSIQHGEEGVRAMIELLLSSPARAAIVCAQDLFALPAEARMNTPGSCEGNWRWRLTQTQFENLPLTWLGERARTHDRA